MIPGSWFATTCPKSLLKGQLLSAQLCACRAETERAAWGEGEFGLRMAWVGACLSKNFGIKWEDGSMEEDETSWWTTFFVLRWHLSWGGNLGQKEWTWNQDKKDHLGDVVWFMIARGRVPLQPMIEGSRSCCCSDEQSHNTLTFQL